MDFYARQAAARGQTRWLVAGFIISLLIVALALDLVLFSFLASADANHVSLEPLAFARRNPAAALFSTVLVMGVLGMASLYKSMELRGGGGVVARNLGGSLVGQDTTDLKRKRLLNVVAEMAIASGVPMPEVYVLEQESAINAFAAGHTPANAAITVTQGALDCLNRDQLQGVIGHEFSHILNGDMRLNVQLMGWVFGLFVVALIGRLILNFSPRNRRGNNGALAVGFAVMVLGYVGLFLGRLMQAAVSRQRERLADASGVQFTRNPQGLKEALVKIAALPGGSLLATPHAEQAAHMFFAAGIQRFFATHPPVLQRIRELDPQFDERELAAMAAQLEKAGRGGNEWSTSDETSGQFRAAGSEHAADATHVGTTGFAAINSALPESLRQFTESPGRAQAFVLALLLSKDPAVRGRQLTDLGGLLSVGNLAVVQQVAPVADSIDPMLRLPALQQIFPALRRAPISQRQALSRMASTLILADARIDAFEFCLAKLLESLLTDELAARAPHGTISLENVQDEIHVLFATLALLGSADEHSASIAYEVGTSGVLPMRKPEYSPPSDWPRQLSDALPRLDRLEPNAKRVLIDGLVKTIASDAEMTEAESELLRTVCALLHVPLPPILPTC